MSDRAYSYPRGRMIFGQAMLSLMVSLIVVVTVAEADVWWEWLLFGSAAAYGYWWVLWKVSRRKARETVEGIHTWDIGFPISVLIRWEEVERFERLGWLSGAMVEAIRFRGRSISIMGIDADSRTSWDGDEPGETDDIVAELNHRLALRRKELGLDESSGR